MRTDIHNTMYYSSSTLCCCSPQITSRIWTGTDHSMRAPASPVVWLWGVWSALTHRSRSGPGTVAARLINTRWISPLATWKVHVQVHWPFLRRDILTCHSRRQTAGRVIHEMAEFHWAASGLGPWWLPHCEAAAEDYFQPTPPQPKDSSFPDV